MAIKILAIDRDKCIGAASCIAVYSDVFEIDAEGKAVLKLKGDKTTSDKTDIKALDVTSVDDDMLLLAAQSCPTAAISLFDEAGTQIYPE
jgi:ferredoxin